MELGVAQGTSSDRREIVALLAAQMAEHAIAIDEGRLGAAIDGVIADGERGVLLVARAGGEAIGVAYLSWIWSLEHGGPSAWLDELYVAPAWRERGVGTRLLCAAIDRARARGCLAIDLEVEASHARAASLYAREGFRAHTRARWVKKLDARP